MVQQHAFGITHRPFERLHSPHRPARYAQQPGNAKRIDQHLLQPHHVANGDDRKRERVRPAGRGIDRAGSGSSLASAEHVRADDKIAVSVERFAGTDHVVPPAGFAVVADASRMGVAGESVGDEDGVRAVRIQMAVCFVCNLNRGERGAAFQSDIVETGALGFNNHLCCKGSETHGIRMTRRHVAVAAGSAFAVYSPVVRGAASSIAKLFPAMRTSFPGIISNTKIFARNGGITRVM